MVLPAGSATLAIAATTATGPSVLRLGKSGSSTFEITQTNGLLSIASTDNAGTCQVAAAAVAMNIVAGGALALNTDEFTVTDGVGAFAGDLTVGGAAGLAGAVDGGPQRLFTDPNDIFREFHRNG